MINSSYLTNVTGYPGLMTGINNATDGLFGLFLMVSIYIMVFMAFKFYDTKTAVIGSSALTLLVSVLLWSMGLILFGYIFIPVAGLLAGLVWLALGSS